MQVWVLTLSGVCGQAQYGTSGAGVDQKIKELPDTVHALLVSAVLLASCASTANLVCVHVLCAGRCVGAS